MSRQPSHLPESPARSVDCQQSPQNVGSRMFSDDSFHDAEDQCTMAVERQRRRFRACCPTLYFLSRFLFKRVIGIALKCFFVFIIAVVFGYTYLIAIPFESQYKPWWLLLLFGLLGLYLFGCTIFYFFMASLTPPGAPPAIPNRHPICTICQNHKPPGTHHCSVCGTCIMKMDHHCVWLNSCIGARNHRYFVQFLGYVTTGMIFLLTAAYNTFYYNWKGGDHRFCASDLHEFPIFDALCGSRRGAPTVEGLTMFVLILAFVLILMVGGFFLWNCVLISFGTTYIECLQGIMKRGRRFGVIPTKDEFINNWRIFFGVSKERSFWSHVLLPSTHVAEEYVRVPHAHTAVEFDGVAVV